MEGCSASDFLIALRKLLDLEVSVSNHEDGGESCDSCAARDDVEGWESALKAKAWVMD